MTAYDVINNALMLIGISADGKAPASYEAITGLKFLNMMRSTWAGRDIMSNAIYDYTFMIPDTRQTITMGSDGTPTVYDIPVRPLKVDQVTVSTSASNTNVVWNVPLISYEEYRLISNNQISTIPTLCAWDIGNPISRIYFYPRIPQGYEVRVMGQSPSTDLISLTDTILEPPDFVEALVYNLATRLAPVFGIPLDPEISKVAHSANKVIKRNMLLAKTKDMINPTIGNTTNMPSFNYITGLSGSNR